MFFCDCKKIFVTSFFVFACFLAIVTAFINNSVIGSDSDTVLHIKIDGEIEHGIAAFISRAIKTAEEKNFNGIVIEINTPGGRLDSALIIKDKILSTEIETISYINGQAFSAGALIALATDQIYMSKGAVIGAATPVMGESGEKASEKMLSGVRKAFASVAESTERNKEIAMAMVDETIKIEGITDTGKLLTLTSAEALEYGISKATLNTRDMKTIAEAAGFSDPKIEKISPSFAEDFVRFITSSYVTSLLLTIGFLALLLEFKAPGWGIAGIISLLAYGLFFWGHHLAGLAGWEAASLMGLGIFLILLEVFVIPGIGIAMVIGVVSLFIGLFMSIVGDVSVASYSDFINAGGIISFSVIGSVILILLIFKYVFKSDIMGSGIVLAGGKDIKYSEFTETESETEGLEVGNQGVAVSDLRPSGIASFSNKRVSVVTRGDFIENGSKVEIEKISGNVVTVRLYSK